MKLLVIAGPPASGKLTVANELAKITDFKIFHNHKSIDIYEDILQFDTPEFWDAVNNLRFETIELAAKNSVNLIFTFCFAEGDEWYIEKLKQITNRYDATLCFAQLKCNKDELLKRVVGESRKKYGKIKNPDELKLSLASSDYYKKIDYDNVLTIDNTNIKPKIVAQQIKKHFDFNA